MPDINRALDTVVTVASNEYKYVATVHKEFDELANIPCYLGDLKQVFLNLIVNAAHAISAAEVEDGIIRIATTSAEW